MPYMLLRGVTWVVRRHCLKQKSMICFSGFASRLVTCVCDAPQASHHLQWTAKASQAAGHCLTAVVPSFRQLFEQVK